MEKRWRFLEANYTRHIWKIVIFLFMISCYPKLVNPPQRIVSYQFLGTKRFELINYHNSLLDSMIIESKREGIDVMAGYESNQGDDMPIYYDLISINNDSLPFWFKVRFFGHESIDLMSVYDLNTNTYLKYYENNGICDNEFLINYFNRNYFNKFKSKFKDTYYNETILSDCP